MSTEYILYQKFVDLNAAEDFVVELKANQIDYKLHNHYRDAVEIFGQHSIDFPISLNLKSEDFDRVNVLLDQYYETKLLEVDSSYHLYEFNDDELNSVILNPYEWGRFDYLLAKRILEDRGKFMSDEELTEIKRVKMMAIQKTVPEKKIKILLSYLSSVMVFSLFFFTESFSNYFTLLLFPLFSLVMSITIRYNRITLPDGKFFYVNTPKDRIHGNYILVLSVISILVIFYQFLLASYNMN
jgi:hypothetical protein